MKAAFYDRLGPARDVLQLGETPDPLPAAGEVRVRVQWSGVLAFWEPPNDSPDLIERYERFLDDGVAADALRGRKVVLDTGNGAAFRIAPEVFRRDPRVRGRSPSATGAPVEAAAHSSTRAERGTRHQSSRRSNGTETARRLCQWAA